MGRGAPERAQRPVPLHRGDAELGIIGGRQIAEAAMRSDGVVVVLPLRQRRSRVRERDEQSLIQEFVPETAVETFDESILGGLSRRDVVPFDA